MMALAHTSACTSPEWKNRRNAAGLESAFSPFLPPINRLTAKSAEDDPQHWRITAPQQRLYLLPQPHGRVNATA
jgi:hypothetical protein